MRINPENRILTSLSELFDVLLGALLCVVCSIPVLTVGASFTAFSAVLADVALQKGDGRVCHRFFSVFRDKFRVSTICALPLFAAAVVFLLDVYACWGYGHGQQGLFLGIFKGISIVLSFVLVSVSAYLFPAIAMHDVTFREAYVKALSACSHNVGKTVFIFCIAVALTALWAILWIFVFPFFAAGSYIMICSVLKAMTGRKKLRENNDSESVDDQIFY